MANIALAFVTGLTTGGLSCLAVQGGLLASSLGNQIEKELLDSSQQQSKKKNLKTRQPTQATGRHAFALPIIAFLSAKVVAYTFLGFLLGLVGSMFQLSPLTRALLQIAIGIYMIGSALRMLNVHPIFRYFVFEPPAFLRRHIRRTASGSKGSIAGPAFLGLLTVFIPCGITQAMMAAALGTANPLEGAALMAAFTLGTSPVFFAVAYFAMQLGSRLEKHFMQFVAVILLLLGILSVDTGLNLAGSPVSLTRAFNGLFASDGGTQASSQPAELQEFNPSASNVTAAQPTDAPSVSGENVVTINIKNSGYSPRTVHARAGEPVKLRLVSNNVYSCALSFVIPNLGIQELLQSSGEKVIDIPAQPQGTVMPFSCSMGMYTGIIYFDL